MHRQPITPPVDAGSVGGLLHRPVCEMLGCRFPLVLGASGGPGALELVRGFTEAGGFGFLGKGDEPAAWLREAVTALRAGTRRRFGVNLCSVATSAGCLDERLAACIEFAVPVVCLAAKAAVHTAGRLRDAGVLVVCQASSPADAREAQEAGAQVLILQGPGMGDHVRAACVPAGLLRDVIAIATIPVLAAGELTAGDGIAAVLSMGAQGAVLAAAVHTSHARFTHDVRPQQAADAAIARLQMHRLAADAAARLHSQRLFPPDRVVLSSPVCYAEEFERAECEDTEREAVVAALNELLEAERAGARVTLRSAAETADTALARLVTAVHHDEVRWCGVLIDALHDLGATPSARTGAFHDKAMAVTDMDERMALLNRGQGWAARKIQALLPRVQDGSIRGALADMWTCHEEHIERVEARPRQPRGH